jgi:hypothetical protein
LVIETGRLGVTWTSISQDRQSLKGGPVISTVKPRVTLRPGGNPEAVPLIGLETYDPEAAIAVLESFLEQDAEEHRATLEFLMDAIDEDRPEGLKIFPGR